ncbi:hypothetical protein NMY22_g4782 [Coprinellus aureogranulatus]|nr:hypothetical protein NMY22_g4782 [Coprinellus aureogranulatus]
MPPVDRERHSFASPIGNLEVKRWLGQKPVMEKDKERMNAEPAQPIEHAHVMLCRVCDGVVCLSRVELGIIVATASGVVVFTSTVISPAFVEHGLKYTHSPCATDDPHDGLSQENENANAGRSSRLVTRAKRSQQEVHPRRLPPVAPPASTAPPSHPGPKPSSEEERPIRDLPEHSQASNYGGVPGEEGYPGDLPQTPSIRRLGGQHNSVPSHHPDAGGRPSSPNNDAP